METALALDLADGFSVSSLHVEDSTGLVVTAAFYTLMAESGAPELACFCPAHAPSVVFIALVTVFKKSEKSNNLTPKNDTKLGSPRP